MDKSLVMKLTVDGSTPLPQGTNVVIYAGDDTGLTSPLFSGFTDANGIIATTALPTGCMYIFTESSGDIGQGTVWNSINTVIQTVAEGSSTGSYPSLTIPSPPAPVTPAVAGWMAADIVAASGEWSISSGSLEFNGASIASPIYPAASVNLWSDQTWTDGAAFEVGKFSAQIPSAFITQGLYGNFIVESWMSAVPTGAAIVPAAATDGTMLLAMSSTLDTADYPFVSIPGGSTNYVNGTQALAQGIPEFTAYGVHVYPVGSLSSPVAFTYTYQDTGNIIQTGVGGGFRLRVALKISALQ